MSDDPLDDPLVKLREIIFALPETSEKLSHGSPTFWGGKKTFASFHVNHHGDGRVALWIKSTLDAQEGLVEAKPALFFVPPYVGPSGWIGLRLDGRNIPWDLVAGMLEEGYRMVAPKKAITKATVESGITESGPSASASPPNPSASASPANANQRSSGPPTASMKM